MGSTLIRGGTYYQVRDTVAAPLRGSEMAVLPEIQDGFLLIENGQIAATGHVRDAPDRADEVIDADGKCILPCWCDSHTHIVFAKSREEEFVMRIRGMSYEEIAAHGGGILNSAEKLRAISEDDLYDQAVHRLHEVISYGTGALEVKSGYGLTPESEYKMLRVIRRLREVSPIPIKATFLGAHAIPKAFRENREEYIRQIIEDMIPYVTGEGLAEYIDVFCDLGFFTPEESDRILEAGTRAGLKAKIHVSEIANIGGVQLGIRHNALSVDHLECAGTAEIQALRDSSTIGTMLPSCAFFLGLDYPPARGLIDGGAAVALATDYNPGSTPSGNMPFVIALACIRMKMLPAEAINAATINGAFAMEHAHTAGRLGPGLDGNVIITKTIPSIDYIPYAFGSNHIDTVVINGRIQHQWK